MDSNVFIFERTKNLFVFITKGIQRMFARTAELFHHHHHHHHFTLVPFLVLLLLYKYASEIFKPWFGFSIPCSLYFPLFALLPSRSDLKHHMPRRNKMQINAKNFCVHWYMVKCKRAKSTKVWVSNTASTTTMIGEFVERTTSNEHHQPAALA